MRRWWGYFTYSLLHVDFGHLFFNLLLQCGVGLGLEMVHGTISVIILFVLGVGRRKAILYALNVIVCVSGAFGIACILLL